MLVAVLGGIPTGTPWPRKQPSNRRVLIAAGHLKVTTTSTGSIAAMPAILKTDLEELTLMTHEQFEREKNYRVALFVAESMLKRGLITDQEYHEIDTILIEKHRPVFGGLCA